MVKLPIILGNMKIGKCGNVEMIVSYKCCPNLHISTFSNFHIISMQLCVERL